MPRLFLLFTLVPLLELYLLLRLGDVMGFWPTVGLVITTGIVGAALAKREGLRVLRTWQTTLAQGRMPEEGLLSAVLVLVGGVLLVAPGVLTDVAGILLLVPPTRKIVATQVRKRLEVRTFGFGAPFRADAAEPVDASWQKVRRPDDVEEDAEFVESRPNGRDVRS